MRRFKTNLLDFMLGAYLTFIFGAIGYVLLTMSSCSPRVIEKIEKQTDTCYIEKVRRDSIYKHDSIYIHEWQKGDTIYVERDRWHYGYRDVFVHDTAYIARHDTLQTIKYVDKPAEISGWKWFQIWAGRLALIAIGLLLGGWALYRFVLKKHF